MEFLKNNTKIAIFKRVEFHKFMDKMYKDCNDKGKKNIRLLYDKMNKVIADKKIKSYKGVAIISEDVNIMGYLLHLQQLCKSFKTCELFAIMGSNKSYFIIS